MVAAKNVIHMNAGDGQNSYANNSLLQRVVISAALPVLDHVLKAMFAPPPAGGACCFPTPTCLRIVDLGCSSGPNTVFAISHILNVIDDLCGKGGNSPEFEVFMNDLPDNDFNNLFKLLPSLNKLQEQDIRSRCSWYGLPGSFYHRLFPTNSLHFAFSCYSMHWLSQIPNGVDNNNKEKIYIARETPPKVLEAYAEQYQRDLSTLLRARSNEIVCGGCMFLIVIGRRYEDYSICEDDGAQYVLLSQALVDMVAEGSVKKADLQSFNLPLYFPCEKEVEAVIRDEGSFNVHKIEGFPVGWDAFGDPETINKYGQGKVTAKCTRAYMEPLLARHFGNSIMDELFERYEKKVAERMSTRKTEYWNLAISVCRK